MNRALKNAVVGVLVAIAITTAMDATGYSVFSARPLIPLAGLFWYLQKYSRREIGLVWGTLGDHGRAATIGTDEPASSYLDDACFHTLARFCYLSGHRV